MDLLLFWLDLFFQADAVFKVPVVFPGVFRKGKVVPFPEKIFDKFEKKPVIVESLDAGRKKEHILYAVVFKREGLSGILNKVESL